MAMSVVYGNFLGGIVTETRSGVERDYVPDPLGSTAALVDSVGTVTDSFEYWPYGELRSRTGTTPTPFQYVGTLGYYTDVLGRLYVRARHYLTQVARWLTVDPLWPRFQAYEYAEGNPGRWVDPSGWSPFVALIAPLLTCQGEGRKRYRDIRLDDPWSHQWCKAACFQVADRGTKDNRLGPIEMRIYNDCVGACDRLAAKGTKRMWCKGIEAAIAHLQRHPKEGYKAVNNKRLLEMLYLLYLEMGCPGKIPGMDD
jgi:RHS repeat-associated protein